MCELYKPPAALSEYITDKEWWNIIKRNVAFSDLPLKRRFEFIEEYLHRCDLDWRWRVGFGSLMDPTDMDIVVQTLKSAALRHVNCARSHLDQGNANAAESIYMRLMRSSSSYCYDYSLTTEFGLPLHDFSNLGDIITYEWSHAYPAMAHSRLTDIAGKLLSDGRLSPERVADIVMSMRVQPFVMQKIKTGPTFHTVKDGPQPSYRPVWAHQ